MNSIEIGIGLNTQSITNSFCLTLFYLCFNRRPRQLLGPILLNLLNGTLNFNVLFQLHLNDFSTVERLEISLFHNKFLLRLYSRELSLRYLNSLFVGIFNCERISLYSGYALSCLSFSLHLTHITYFVLF
jgi:hypothetical protein